VYCIVWEEMYRRQDLSPSFFFIHVVVPLVDWDGILCFSFNCHHNQILYFIPKADFKEWLNKAFVYDIPNFDDISIFLETK